MKSSKTLLFFSVFILLVFCTPHSAFAVISPTDISGLQLWLKADSLSLNDGDPVATWTDSSGQSHNATNGPGDHRRPTYQTNELNSLPVVRFDGVDDGMVSTVSFSQNMLTMFVVGMKSGAGDPGANQYSRFASILKNGNLSTFDYGDTSGWTGIGITTDLAFATPPAQFTYRNSSLITTLPAGNYGDWAVMAAILNGSNVLLARDGITAAGTTSAAPIDSDRVWIGDNERATDSLLNGDIAEVIVYDSALSTTDRQNVETYLGAKYGITVPDTTAPSVSLTAPVAGTSLKGEISLEATASDNIGVSGVQFKLDTNTLIGAEDTTSTYGVTWNSNGVTEGTHTISAVARDAAGNYATSTVTITVNRNHARHASYGPVFTTSYSSSILVSTPAPTPSTTPTTSISTPPLSFVLAPTFTKDLYLNLTDPEVKLLQVYLNTHGFPVASTGPGSLGNETNRFGTLTRAALIRFQKGNNITPAVGYFGPLTRVLVNSN